MSYYVIQPMQDGSSGAQQYRPAATHSRRSQSHDTSQLPSQGASPAAVPTHNYDRHSSVDSIDREYCSSNCIAVMVAVSTVALVTINILALYGFFNTQTLSIINTSVLGTASLISLVALRKSDDKLKKMALLTTCVVLIACSGLSALGIFKVFNTTQVTWTVFAPLIAASGLALVLSIANGLDSRNENKIMLAGSALAVVTVALIALNIVAMKGHLSAPTIGIINTTIFGSITLLSVPLFFIASKPKVKLISLAIFLIFGTMASLASLGIAGHFSATSVGWTLFVPIITAASIAVLAGGCVVGCAYANK